MQRILITPGEPAGIGPDITIAIAQQAWPAEIIALADPNLLAERAKQIGCELDIIEYDVKNLLAAPSTQQSSQHSQNSERFQHPQSFPYSQSSHSAHHQAKTLKVIPHTLHAKVKAGELNPANSAYVLATLKQAADLCLNQQAEAIVTGPVHKAVMNQAGIAFSGHTEFFAQHSHVPHTVMLFVIDDLKVALASTHLPLAKVPQAITKEKLELVLSILHADLKQKFRISSPNILVCGLNPHAGEGGYLGREEIDTISPLLNDLRSQGYRLEGPLPADTIFTPPFLQRADAILAMYHDQALPVVKCLGFGNAVNVTLGLPFVRTSVDHGTALDIAGKQLANTITGNPISKLTGNLSGKPADKPLADANSMAAALNLAIKLSKKA
jgi:4-hydroxythreonine-4-phosphate dehydrogenase